MTSIINYSSDNSYCLQQFVQQYPTVWLRYVAPQPTRHAKHVSTIMSSSSSLITTEIVIVRNISKILLLSRGTLVNILPREFKSKFITQYPVNQFFIFLRQSLTTGSQKNAFCFDNFVR